MVDTHANENKQMEEELATIKTKLKDLDKKILILHLPHSPMSNRRQLDSFVDTGSSSSCNFLGLNIEFPRFNGDDSTGWIYKYEQYFSLHNTLDVNKVSLTSFHLEHEALLWFCWYIKAHDMP